MKYLFTIAFCFSSCALFAQQKQKQFMVIVRSNVSAKPTYDEIQINMKHWGDYMADLGKIGAIASGYRPTPAGETISGKSQTSKKGPYIANDEEVSSVLIINAADMNAAKQIAAKCPVLELGGNVEVRPVQNAAN